jgi:shikimate kinase
MLGLTPHSDRNLILTGYIGPNQLLIVRQIAKRLNLPFVNFELRLEERADMPMTELRELFGEARLKTLEADVIDEMVLYRGALLFIGGQTLMRNDYLARLRGQGTVLCLVASLDAVLQRLHLAMGARYHTPAERAIALGHLKREWSVRRADGVREFDTTGMTDNEIVESVAMLWREEALLTRG